MTTQIELNCPGCGKLLHFSPDAAGDVGVCRVCNAEITIPFPVKAAPDLLACSDCGKNVSRRATACPHCGAPMKTSFASKLGSVPYLPGVDRMPTIQTRKSPVLAFVIGCLFGCIGTGIYFRTFLDFFVPFVVFLVLAIAGVGIGAIPGWLFAGVWGLFRALDANRRLDSQ